MPALGWGASRAAVQDAEPAHAGPVAGSAFEDDFEPHPRHWRRPPRPWPADLGAETVASLRAAIDDLPRPWRRAVMASDVHGRPRAEVASELGLTVAQLRDVLDRARAALRDGLDAGRGPR